MLFVLALKLKEVSNSTNVPAYCIFPLQDINPYFLDFSASTNDLVHSVVTLLQKNKWYSIIVVTDGSTSSTDFVRHMRTTTIKEPHMHLYVVLMTSKSKVRTRLTELQSLPSRIVILHCDNCDICVHVLKEARSFNLLSNQWIWIVVRDRTVDHIASQYGGVAEFEGLLAIRSRYHVKTRQVLRSLLKVFASVLKRVDTSYLQSMAVNNTGEDVTCSSGTYSTSRKKFLVSVHR